MGFSPGAGLSHVYTGIVTNNLADPADLARVLGTPADDPAMLSALARASARFRAAVGHTVTRTTETLLLSGSGARHIRAALIRPVLVKAEALDSAARPSEWSAVPAVIDSRTGVLARTDGGVWPAGLANVRVTVEHGYAGVPGDIADAVLEQAVMTAQTAGLAGYSQVSQGQRSLTVSATALSGVTRRWEDAVSRHSILVGGLPE